jgi:hypothetical protein
MMVPLTGFLLLYNPLITSEGFLTERVMRMMQQLGLLCWSVGMVIWIANTQMPEESVSFSHFADFLFNSAVIFWAYAVRLWGQGCGYRPLQSKHFFTSTFVIPMGVATFAATILFFFGLQGDGTYIDEPVLSLLSVLTTTLMVFIGVHTFLIARLQPGITSMRWYFVFLLGCILYMMADLQELIFRSEYVSFDGSLSDVTFLIAIGCISAAFLHFESGARVKDDISCATQDLSSENNALLSP